MVKRLSPEASAMSCHVCLPQMISLMCGSFSLLMYNKRILWLWLLLETELWTSCLQAGYVFPLELDFRGRHLLSF